MVKDMPAHTLTALSPLDGRYARSVDALRVHFSESALIRYRLRIEIEWLKALAAEPHARVRALYVEALSRIRSPEAAQTLVAVAIDHADAETRILAVERLAAIDAAAAAGAILPALGGGDNGRINRAAAAVGRLGCASAVGPLIDVLETEHVVATDGPPEGSTTATFTPSGGGLAVGGGVKRRKVRMQNQQVLEALVTLTGADFSWDVDAWRAWLASRQSPPDFDPRRDR